MSYLQLTGLSSWQPHSHLCICQGRTAFIAILAASRIPGTTGGAARPLVSLINRAGPSAACCFGFGSPLRDAYCRAPWSYEQCHQHDHGSNKGKECQKYQEAAWCVITKIQKTEYGSTYRVSLAPQDDQAKHPAGKPHHTRRQECPKTIHCEHEQGSDKEEQPVDWSPPPSPVMKHAGQKQIHFPYALQRHRKICWPTTRI
jgi:hypothetical protein